MRFFLIASVSISCCIAAHSQDWHPIESSFCSQIKVKGAKVSNRPFSIFAATEMDTKCCEGLNLKTNSKTWDFGHFRVVDLQLGRYFLSFDLKTKQVNVPIFVKRVVDKRSVGKDCEPTSKITVDNNTNQLKWEEWIVVD